MRPRCAQHGLATSPDGSCVLCRSRRPTPPAWHFTGASVGLVALALAGLSVWGYRHATRARGAVPSAVVSVPRTSAFASPAASVPATTQDLFERRQISERDPRGVGTQLRIRGETDVEGQYYEGQESCELFVPAAARTGSPHGLLVWISSDPTGQIPNPEWAKQLAAHHLAWVGPNQVSNEREVALRIGLALDAIIAAKQRFNLDESRVYIGGLSGGAKSAFRALLYYPEVFHGALLAAGIEYFRPVAVRARAAGVQWPERFGTPRYLAQAKALPVAITTGMADFNFEHINDVVVGMRVDGFTHVQVFNWPNLAHAPPPAAAFERALAWLESHGN